MAKYLLIGDHIFDRHMVYHISDQHNSVFNGILTGILNIFATKVKFSVEQLHNSCLSINILAKSHLFGWT